MLFVCFVVIGCYFAVVVSSLFSSFFSSFF